MLSVALDGLQCAASPTLQGSNLIYQSTHLPEVCHIFSLNTLLNSHQNNDWLHIISADVVHIHVSHTELYVYPPSQGTLCNCEPLSGTFSMLLHSVDEGPGISFPLQSV